MFLSIVIPAYNEEERIGETLAKYWSFFGESDTYPEVEFVIVVNGSTDNTIGIVKAFAAAHPSSVQYRDIKEEIGKGGAIREGFGMATGDLIGFVDADAATSPVEFAKVVTAAQEYDGAIASRWKRGSEVINRSIARNLASWGFRMVVRLLFWFPYADTQCGAKAFSRSVVDTILPELKVNNMATDVEMLQRCRKHHFAILEVPTRWVDKSGSAFLGSPFGFFKSAFQMLFILLSIRFRS